MIAIYVAYMQAQIIQMLPLVLDALIYPFHGLVIFDVAVQILPHYIDVRVGSPNRLQQSEYLLSTFDALLRAYYRYMKSVKLVAVQELVSAKSTKYCW
jgi:hypothetical protein